MLTGGGALLAILTLRCANKPVWRFRLPMKAQTALPGTGKALEYEKQLRHAIDYDS